MLHENAQSSWKDVLKESRFDFFLTGSRFFGTARPDSDWDYYVELPDSVSGMEALFNDLKKAGLQKEEWEAYADVNCDEVWQGNNVHIQIVKNAHAKTLAQKVLRDSSLFSFGYTPTKMGAKEIWNLVYAAMLAEAGVVSMLELRR